MVAAKTGDMMRDAWEDFLGHYYRAMEKTCRIATDCKHKKIRGLGWRLVEASNKNDPGLRFLRHARNEVDHAVAPFAGIDEAHVRIGGGAIELGGSGRANIYGCNFNGQLIDHLEFQRKDGRILQSEAKNHPAVKEMPDQVRLRAIQREGHKAVPVPNMLGGRRIEPYDPTTLAKAGILLLERQLNELDSLAQ
jgi:hypothetical protein